MSKEQISEHRDWIYTQLWYFLRSKGMGVVAVHDLLRING